MEYQYVWAYIDHVKRSCEDESTQSSSCVISGVCGKCDVAKVDVEGVLTCPSCGTVDAMSIDEKPEWISSVNELGVYAADNSSRCDFKKDSNAKLLFSQQWGAGTQIRTKWSSSVAHKRMSTINFRLASHHRDRALYHAYAKIDEKATSLPDSVRVHAKLFYKRFTELKLTRGDVRLGATANCIIMACKLAGISRTNAEVADMWGIDVRHVTRTSELVRQTLASDAYRTAHTNTTGTTYGAKPRELLARIWNRFDTTDAITGRERRDAEFLCTELEGCRSLQTRAPKTIAAAAILISIDRRLDAKIIGARCEVTVPTLLKAAEEAEIYLKERHCL